MERLGVPIAPFSSTVLRIFENGHSVHERIQEELQETGILVKPEAALSSAKHNMKGHTDGIGIVNVPGVGGVMVILEIKSCGENSWKWMMGNGRWKGKGPDRAHIWQVQLYMFMSGLNYAVLIYENKNTQERAYFVVKRDGVLIEETLLPRVDLINIHTEQKTLPMRDSEHLDPQPDGKTPTDCSYCSYSAVCKREEELFSMGETIDLVKLGAELLGGNDATIHS